MAADTSCRPVGAIWMKRIRTLYPLLLNYDLQPITKWGLKSAREWKSISFSNPYTCKLRREEPMAKDERYLLYY